MSLKVALSRSKYATAAVLVAVFSVITMFPHKAFAAGLANGCGDNLSAWDWPSWTAKSSVRSGSITGGGVPGFSASSGSYIIFGKGSPNHHTSGGVSTDATSYLMYAAVGNTDRILMYQDASGNEWMSTLLGSGIYEEAVTDSSNVSFTAITNLPSVFANGGPFSTVQINGSGGVVNSGTFPAGQCVAASANLVYAGDWTDPQYTVAPKWTSGVGGPGGVDCSCIKVITCAVANAFNGVADDILAGFKAFAGYIGNIFLPDGTQLSSDWNNFYTGLQTKLGFLLWPFSFIGGLFSAVTTPASCCSIPGATFFGRTMPSIDLTYAATAMPTIWAYCQAVVRGMTILLLIFALRKKFLEITHK